MSRTNEIIELTRVRVLTFLREPEAIFWVFVFPLVLAAVLGFAFRSGSVAPSAIAVVGPAPLLEAAEHDDAASSDAGAIDVDEPTEALRVAAGTDAHAALLLALVEDEHAEVTLYEDRDEAFVALRKSKVDVLVEPHGPVDDVAGAGHAADARVPRMSVDPTRTEGATAELRVRRALRRAAGDPEEPLVVEPVTETGSRYIDFLFPGLLGMNLMGTGMWGIGFAVADVRRRKFLKRLMVTPMRRSSFLLGFILSRLVFLVLEVGVLAGIAVLILDVPLRGGLIPFFVVCLLGAASFAGLGLLAASRARTIEAVSGLINFIMMPMWLASGVFFSYERFPEALHPLLRLLPLTSLNDALRAIMLDGESILGQGPELAIVAGWGVVSFVIALRIFRWT